MIIFTPLPNPSQIHAPLPAYPTLCPRFFVLFTSPKSSLCSPHILRCVALYWAWLMARGYRKKIPSPFHLQSMPRPPLPGAGLRASLPTRGGYHLLLSLDALPFFFFHICKLLEAASLLISPGRRISTQPQF